MRKLPHVKISDFHPQLIWALFEIDEIVREQLGYEAILTSANDGTHKWASAHYRGMAVDLRTWTAAGSGEQISDARRLRLRDAIKEAIGTDFDVVSESDHIHIEYDPKSPT